MIRRKILAIASNVRDWAEEQAAGTYMAGTLEGMCAIASAELWRQLKQAGIDARIRVWQHRNNEMCHVFLVVDDYVLDVTATQFRALKNKRIYFEHEKEADAYYFYFAAYEFNTDRELVYWQEDVGFVEDQIAFA